MSGGGNTNSGPSSRPNASAESTELYKKSISLKEVFPKIKSSDDLENAGYADLMGALKDNPNKIPDYAKSFYKSLTKLEGDLNKVALKEFSWDKAKAAASGNAATLGKFSSLERQIQIVQATNPAANVQLNELFSALDQAEFDEKLGKRGICHASLAADPTFKSKAQTVFNHILKYRNDNASDISQDQISEYLKDIFTANNDEIDKKINDSGVISAGLIDNQLRGKIHTGYQKYHKFRELLKKRYAANEIVRAETRNLASKPLKKLRSVEKGVTKLINNFRDNWEGLDSNKKIMAGGAMLFGVAWFLNTNNEEVGKIRDALKTGGMLAVGYYGVNYATQALTNKSLTRHMQQYADDRSGKRDVLKKTFNTDKDGALALSNTMANLANDDFSRIAKLYLHQSAKQDDIQSHLRVLKTGVPEGKLSSKDAWKAMTLIDKKLKSRRNSVSDALKGIEAARFEAKKSGKRFVEPTFGQVMAAILMDDELAWRTTSDGKVEAVDIRELETTWLQSDRSQTVKWWRFTDEPTGWRVQAYQPSSLPDNRARIDHLKRISKDVMPYDRPLSRYITQNKFGKYTTNFLNLYELKFKLRPRNRMQYLENTQEQAMYMTSRVSVDTTTFPSLNIAKVAAVKNAYQQSLKDLKKKLEIQYKGNANLPNILANLDKYVHPAGGVFLSPSTKTKKGVKGKKKPLSYVMFLRMSLPGSMEHILRSKDEWPEGDTIEQMNSKPMMGDDRLTRSDFITIARESKRKTTRGWGGMKFKGYDSPFSGAYESFLARFGLKKTDTTNIEIILENISLDFVNKDMTKAGLMRYLASHKFTMAEKRKYMGISTGPLPLTNFKFDIYQHISTKTYDIARTAHATKPVHVNYWEVAAEITSKLGMTLIQACAGEAKALKAIEGADPILAGQIKSTFGVAGGIASNINAVTLQRFRLAIMPRYGRVVMNIIAEKRYRNKAVNNLGPYLADL